MVPVDHADPGRGSLDLAAVRVRAADDNVPGGQAC
jgi:hypothetical protein